MISQIKTRTLEDPDISHSGGTLAEGQTRVSFALVQEGDVTADGSGALSATWSAYLDEQGDSQGTVLVGIGETDTGSGEGEDGDDYLEGGAGQDTFTIKSIADCARTTGATRHFDCENRAQHFAADLNKLGTNIAGLNVAAQNAIIAQGIEWYYWQGTDYAGQEFFVNNTAQPGLLQYTTAISEGLAGAQNKALSYLNAWLTPIYNDSGEFGERVSFDQWSVAASAAGVTSTARDTSKTQIFIGQCGADSFTGGDKADTLLGGAGDDTLVGGAGNDIPAGGAGTDNYEFDSAGTGFCNDTITDSDGLGQIKIGGATATGGKLVMDNVWESGDRTLIYSVHDGKLIIGQRRSAGAATVGGTITVNNWQNGLLGVNLQNVAVEPPAVANAYSQLGQTRTYAGYNTAGILIAAGSDNWLGTGNGSGGATFQGEDGQAYSSLDIAGLIGNDILYGFGNADKLDGGEGDDVIFGGLGADQIQGGAGNDVIMSNVNASNSSVNWTPENAALYPNALDWSGGTSASLGNEFEGQSYVNGSVNNWTIKRDANGNLLMLDFQALRTGSSNPANNDLLYGGEGNDLFVGNGKFATKLIAAQARDSGSRYRFSSEAKSLVVSNHRQCPQPTQQGLARRNTAAHDSHLRFPA